MNVKFVDLAKQNKELKKELLPVIEKTIDDAIFIGGKPVDDFEALFAQFCKKKYAVGVNSGTDALKLALLAYGINPGDEVITVPNSYFSTAMVISDIGAKPVFVDVFPTTHAMDYTKLEWAITKKTKAIIPVHLYGQSANMDPILSIAKKHYLVVIEDACQAHGALYKGNIVPVSETGAFSFYPGKNLGCFGDGGIVVTDNLEVKERLLYLRNDGSTQKYVHKKLGIKSRLDTIQAAILSIKLPYLDGWNEKRREHAQYYNKLLHEVDGVVLPVEDTHNKHIYHIYAIEVEKRDDMRVFLSTQGIETNIHYPIPIHLQEAYASFGFSKGMFPVTEEKAEKILSLPMYPELTNKEIEYVCSKIKEFLSSQ